MGLFLELGGTPADGGGNALGGDDVAEFDAEFSVRRIERADDVESDIKRRAEVCSVSGAVDRALGGIKGFRRDQR